MTVTERPAAVNVSQSDWLLCERCHAIVYARRFTSAGRVCPECRWHAPLTAVERVAHLLDDGSVSTLEVAAEPFDHLGFVDSRPYAERLASARHSTGLDEAVICRRGTIEGHPVLVAVMDVRFMGGSMGSAVGELITQTAEIALRERTPLLIVSASGGARMQEGAISLMQMAKTSQAVAQLDEAGILTISLVTDPTYGGVAASYATQCDVILAEPGARLGFAGPRVIQQTIGTPLPDGFQTAEMLLSKGLIDGICEREAQRQVLAQLLSLAGGQVLDSAAPVPEDPLIKDSGRLPDDEPWQSVRRARHQDRPTTSDYLCHLLDGFVELHGDRTSGDCTAIIAGCGRLDGVPLIVIGHQKGHTAAELAAHNFGMATPSGYRKAARVMRLAAKLGLPVLTLIDTPGAYPGVEAEEQGQAIAIAENLRLMSGLPVPIVAVIIGEGGSGGALALAVANRVLMCANATYSVISPEGCAAILWKEARQAPAAAAALGLRARDLLRSGIVDAVIPERGEGTHECHADAARMLREALLRTLGELAAFSPDKLIADRWARFRDFGRLAGR
ncbi:MAG TPA: acetyl-CoA carboxylase carboxyltransferase subunit alpha [Streptosporangiaceae bacterium]|nr:acetyl-CoA carboxylase carboxyltransferase subunit alpha [Streptosporangiaceae bacterium]